MTPITEMTTPRPLPAVDTGPQETPEAALLSLAGPEVNPTSLFDKAILVCVQLHRVGVRRAVKKTQIRAGSDVAQAAADTTTDADPTMIAVSKQLIDSPELDAIVSFDGELRRWLAVKAVPTPFHQSGAYAIADGMLLRVDQELTRRQATREGLVRNFLAVYEQRAAEGRARLNSLGDDADYPTIDQVLAAFSFTVNYQEFGPPGRLGAISQALAQRERENAVAEIQNTLSECQYQLRTMFSTLIDRIADRLAPTDDGKPKRFVADTLVGNLIEFVEDFAAKNEVAGDLSLATLVERGRSLLAGIGADPTKLRTDDALRTEASGAAARLKADVDRLVVVERASRRVYKMGGANAR